MGSYTDRLFKRDRIKQQSEPPPYKGGYSGMSPKQKTVVSPERLTACYIRRDGETYSYGFRSHYDIRKRLGDADPLASKPGDEEGFITSEDRFVSRDEANRIGATAGQCVRMERKFLSSDVDRW